MSLEHPIPSGGFRRCPESHPSLDYEEIVKTSIAPYEPQLQAGKAGLQEWREIFSEMHLRLIEAQATPEQCDGFRMAIRRATDRARGNELSDAERALLLDVLWAVFHRHALPTASKVTPGSGFLKYLNFDALRSSSNTGHHSHRRQP